MMREVLASLLGLIVVAFFSACGGGSGGDGSSADGGFNETMFKNRAYAMDFYTDQTTLGGLGFTHVVGFNSDGTMTLLNEGALVSWREGFSWSIENGNLVNAGTYQGTSIVDPIKLKLGSTNDAGCVIAVVVSGADNDMILCPKKGSDYGYDDTSGSNTSSSTEANDGVSIYNGIAYYFTDTKWRELSSIDILFIDTCKDSGGTKVEFEEHGSTCHK